VSDTLLLDRSRWDLVVDATGNIAMASTTYSTQQDVASAVRTFQGEVWYDTSLGVPYWGQVLGQQPPLSLVKSLVVTEALRVPNVVSARMYVSSFTNRQIQGQIQAKTTSGQILVSETGSLAAQAPSAIIISPAAAAVVPPVAPPTQHNASSLLAGAGSFTTVFQHTYGITAALPGAGSITAATTGPTRASAALGGVAGLTVSPQLRALSQASLAGAGSLAAVPSGTPHTYSVSAVLAAAGALAANETGIVHWPASAALGGAGSLTATGLSVPAWNQNDDTGFTLSNSNATATTTAAGAAGVRTSNSIPSGAAVYLEFTLSAGGAESVAGTTVPPAVSINASTTPGTAGSGNVLTIVGGQVAVNGTAISATSGVTELYYTGSSAGANGATAHSAYQFNGTNWYGPIISGSGGSQLAGSPIVAVPLPVVGFATSAWSRTTVLGSDGNSVGLAPSGAVTLNGATIGTIVGTPTPGARIDAAINNSTQLAWFRLAPPGGTAGLWGAATASSTSGSQTVGTSGPKVTGPASGIVQSGGVLPLTVTATDTAWPGSPATGLVVTTSIGILTMTGPTTIVGSGTSSISMSDTNANVLTALSTLSLEANGNTGSIGSFIIGVSAIGTTAQPAGTTNVVVKITDANAVSNQITIPVTVVPVPDPEDGTGGISYAGISAGNLFFAASAAATGAVVTINELEAAFVDTSPVGFMPAALSGLGAAPPPASVTSGGETATTITVLWTPG
jgi:hypothetical protein